MHASEHHGLLDFSGSQLRDSPEVCPPCLPLRFFAMIVHVYLPSGKSCSVELLPESSCRELKAKAQRRFGRFLRLTFRRQQLDPSTSLSTAGVRDGDAIDAVVQRVELAFTRGAFALSVEGTALAWGNPEHGGLPQIQFARIRQIQATEKAFAAILDDGSVEI